jgi:RNA polymerase sigma factor (sigma-70 family)
VSRAIFDRDGDLARFTELYAEHRADLLAHVRSTARRMRLTEGQVDAEGVVQETFLDACERWPTLERPERWIYTVARRKVGRHVRLARADRRTRERLESTACAPPEPDPHFTRVQADEVIDRILALPGNQRDATYLHHVQGWTGPEIARHLGVTTGTVYAHIHRGLRRVRLGLADTARHGGALIAVLAAGIGAVLTGMSDALKPVPAAMPFPGARSPKRTGDGSALDIGSGLAGSTSVPLGIAAVLLMGGAAALLLVRRRAKPPACGVSRRLSGRG